MASITEGKFGSCTSRRSDGCAFLCRKLAWLNIACVIIYADKSSLPALVMLAMSIPSFTIRHQIFTFFDTCRYIIRPQNLYNNQ